MFYIYSNIYHFWSSSFIPEAPFPHHAVSLQLEENLLTFLIVGVCRRFSSFFFLWKCHTIVLERYLYRYEILAGQCFTFSTLKILFLLSSGFCNFWLEVLSILINFSPVCKLFFSGCFQNFLFIPGFQQLMIQYLVNVFHIFILLEFDRAFEFVNVCVSPNLESFQVNISSSIFLVNYLSVLWDSNHTYVRAFYIYYPTHAWSSVHSFPFFSSLFLKIRYILFF